MLDKIKEILYTYFWWLETMFWAVIVILSATFLWSYK